jgi:hypothetical protein
MSSDFRKSVTLEPEVRATSLFFFDVVEACRKHLTFEALQMSAFFNRAGLIFLMGGLKVRC